VGTPAQASITTSISGQVVLPDDAEPGNFQGIQVWAQRVDGGVNTVPGGFDYGYTWINTPDGTYDITSLNPGVYTVQFRMLPYGPSQIIPGFAPEFFSNSYTEDGATPVDVTSGNATNVHALLEWAGSISGTVALGADMSDADLQGVRVIALGPGGFTAADVDVESDGSYLISQLPAGAYKVFFDKGLYLGAGGVTTPGYVREYYDDVYDSDDATVVTVAGQANVTGIDALLETTGHFTSSPTPVITYLALNAGSTLGISGGTWAPQPTFSKRWYRNGVAISGATASTYEITPTDRGKDITFQLTASKAGFTSLTRTSAAVHIPLVFTRTVTPTITGTAKAGYVLTAHRGTWSPLTTSNGYQWKRDGGVIAGANASTYKLVAADRGHDITVTVTGSRAGYLATNKTSAPLHIARVFTKTVVPTITGTAKAGYTLTAHRGTWSPTPTYSYRWYRNGVAISGATKYTYKLTSSDKGKKITVRVTGKRSGYLTTSKTSAPKAVG
jgi:hypothetical protein